MSIHLNKMTRAFLFALVFISVSFANKVDRNAFLQDSLNQVKTQKLKNEVDALIRIRLEKANQLEKLEATHWRAKYQENLLTEEYQSQLRNLESRYSKLSTDLGRLSEEWIQSKTATGVFEERASEAESSLEAFQKQISIFIQKSLEELPGSFPLNLENRMLQLTASKNALEQKRPNFILGISGFYEELLQRHAWTYTQNLEQRYSMIGLNPDVKVNHLRLGTVFLAEVALENEGVQTLIRTGALQGKIFEWNHQLSDHLEKNIRQALSKSQSDSLVWIPIDVLQNKSIKELSVKVEEKNLKTAFIDWFNKGGIVMYPLALTALLALVFSLERFLVLTKKGRLSRRFDKRLKTMLKEKKINEAMDLCLRYNTSLSMVLWSVLQHAFATRETAEKALQETLLREQPKLEKRMGFIAALGTIAPLLGLLGTVTGIITLFTVITEVGTNDARVLAGGISEALITTETGLLIAIPVMLLHGFLSEKVEQVTSELYVQSMSLLNQLFKDS